MTPRTMAGVALLCALALIALDASGASAAAANNTTAFTCVPNGGAKDFTDAHCDESTTAGKGSFGHVAIPIGTETKVVTTNAGTKNKTSEATPAVLKGSLGGIELEITCSSATGEGTFTNLEPSSKVHTGSGSGSSTFSSCTVNKPANCTVKSIAVNIAGVPVEGIGAGNKMGGEVSAPAGKPLTSFVLEGGSCALKEKALEVTGSAIVTGTPKNELAVKQSGATAIYSSAEEMQKLTIGGKSATFSVTTTVKQAGGEKNPIAATTVT